MTSTSCFVGLDIGGTTLKALAFNSAGQILAEQSTPTNDDGSETWLTRTRDLAHAILQRCPPDTSLGIAAPGLPSSDGLSIASMPGRLKGIEGLNWQQWIGLKSEVPVVNDAHAALLGEIWLGAAKGSKNIVLLTLGTGVGGAVMVDGRLLRGHLGRAGHLGHISLDPDGPKDIVKTPGSLEDAIGEHTLPRRSSGRFRSTSELLQATRAGNQDAARIWSDSVRCLGIAIAGFINLFDPELVVLGGGIADAGPSLFEPLQATLDEFEWRPTGAKVRITKAELGPAAGATGAAFAARLSAGNGVLL